MKRLTCLVLCALFMFEGVSLSLYSQRILTAQVTAVSGSNITIDQGSSSGLKSGAEGVVYYNESVAGRRIRVSVALVRVTSVSSSSARLRVLESTAPVEQGYLVDLRIATVTPSIPSQAQEKKKGGSKWWIWVLVAAAGGGIAAAVSGGGGGGDGDGDGDTGTISIDLPAN